MTPRQFFGVFCTIVVLVLLSVSAGAGHTGAPDPGVLAWTEQHHYLPDEDIVIAYAGLPGNARDWISLAAADSSDQSYRHWTYTGGSKQGTHTFSGLAPGRYEVRVYFDWSSGGYTVHSRFPFVVSEQRPAEVITIEDRQPSDPPAPGILAWPEHDHYAAGEEIRVHFLGLPGNRADWISISEAGSSDTSYLRWTYTQGAKEGLQAFRGVDPGEYEVRVYFNWPSGRYTVHSRFPFIVTETGYPADPAPELPDTAADEERDPVLQPSAHILAWTEYDTYSQGQDIAVHFAGLPGNRSDWISLSALDSADRSYIRWTYTNHARTGSHTFSGLEPGYYEVRVYFDWPRGGYTVQSRFPFSVTE